jgi:hypothetical protein
VSLVYEGANQPSHMSLLSDDPKASLAYEGENTETVQVSLLSDDPKGSLAYEGTTPNNPHELP